MLQPLVFRVRLTCNELQLRRSGSRSLSQRLTASETPSEITQVSNILTKSLAALGAASNEKDRAKAFTTVQAAYGKLETLVVPPSLLLQQISMTYQLPMVLGTVNDLGIAEVISESTDPKGRMSSKDIEKRCGVPAGKVSRFLRFLAGRGIFEEVAPDVWTHTKASRLLDSGLSYEEIARDPIHRFAKGAPIPAWISHTVEQGGMAAVSMVTALREDKYKKSEEVFETPFNKIYDTDVPFWQWLEQEGRVLNMTKGFEMNNTRNVSPQFFDFSYYPWRDLPENSTIVDVGGGVGSAMAIVLPLAPKGTKFIVQDLSYPVLEHAKTFWAERDSTAVQEGRVVLQRHDFHQPQPVKGAAVYFMRFILHDWKDETCIEILKHLHHTANEESRLLIVEAVIAHACHDIGSLTEGAVEGAYPTPMPEPLPANGGRAAEFEASFDMHMMNVLNGVERTYEQFRQIAEKAGWKPQKVYQTDELSSLKILEFVKV
ncbi:hypothetical protein M407DRAFT_217354 [Tulasnella calospora MUT 4182]|uniref:Uncharacterized protein n=1 Tax=Tulasnella calospora MUT 4182 TaxID=1051891 RepID=A0A0C3Q1B4_9AGAM|nr:hypothetical protein M407DRAFT_217354 [Tulasnella calospora MUT 4182]